MEALPDDQIVPLWIENCYAASTRRAYASEWRRFERFCRSEGLSSSLKDIRPSTLKDFLNSRSLAESSKRTFLIIYRSLFAFAKRCGYRGISPAHLLRCPRPNETIHERILSENDLEKMLQCAKTKRDYMIVSFFHSSGARISEVGKLRMKDLTHRTDGSVDVMLHGKGGKKRRVVLSRAFSKRLKAFVRGLPEGAPLFSGQRGPLTSSGLRKVIKRIVLRAELNRHISPHFLRHMHSYVMYNHICTNNAIKISIIGSAWVPPYHGIQPSTALQVRQTGTL